MSSLTYAEKQKFEQLLDMGGGYVLAFSNRSFRECVMDTTGCDIYTPRYEYESNSKANRLRAFWTKEDDALVGKLLNELVDISGKTGLLEQQCRQVISRLQGNGSRAQPAAQPHRDEQASHQRSETLRQLRDEFCSLAAESDRSKAGLDLEKLLNRLFGVFQLQPRQPFRVVGEQIDGSFELDGEIYLVESKWEKGPLPEADLLVFRGKIEGKSTFTRGVLIALNGISNQARDAITRGKAPSFFVVDGYDLLMVLSETVSLTDFLRRRVRLLAEEGRVSVPFSELAV